MGVYKKAHLDKTGQEIISKAALVASIEDALGLELPTLIKAGKEDLRRIASSLE
jgi:hypothetical protein